MKAHDRTDAVSALAELGHIKLGETDLDGVLHRVADLAVRTLPGAVQASITLSRDQGAHTGAAALLLDRWQYDRDTGPSLEAARTGSTVEVPDAAADGRWDDWGAEAARAGMSGALAVHLPIRDGVNGALTVYGSGLSGAGMPELARSFARYAAVALANAHLYDTTAGLARQMQAAMESRAVIEQAKGIIMGERRCSPDEAFAILTRVSQDSNRKLRDVASALVERTQRG
ncbi:GAF and ANTAR domain-containing protein [Actinoplanes couchii]|uniref:Transcriptional regulator n=1 Tax=Actinoplanes couchii TaxID=403638 RepID=A0ABQ3X076_9ACTN|nr:GAF and ANTAR domain-containing protein [Actinoplanes couchii]MDR6316317.1 GAF domain-containing protein [Actinoplanes couchii]GID51931.1 transcriptional regulator [Actinoplanes couchii]